MHKSLLKALGFLITLLLAQTSFATPGEPFDIVKKENQVCSHGIEGNQEILCLNQAVEEKIDVIEVLKACVSHPNTQRFMDVDVSYTECANLPLLIKSDELKALINNFETLEIRHLAVDFDALDKGMRAGLFAVEGEALMNVRWVSKKARILNGTLHVQGTVNVYPQHEDTHGIVFGGFTDSRIEQKSQAYRLEKAARALQIKMSYGYDTPVDEKTMEILHEALGPIVSQTLQPMIKSLRDSALR